MIKIHGETHFQSDNGTIFPFPTIERESSIT